MVTEAVMSVLLKGMCTCCLAPGLLTAAERGKFRSERERICQVGVVYMHLSN